MSGRAAIDILALQGLATIQDRGRAGWMHDGVPPGGALVPELAARANAAAGNAADASMIEVFGGLRAKVVGQALRVGTEEGRSEVLAPGAEIALKAARSLRCRYLAVHGGFDVPRVLGSRGTLLVARLGGHEGRPLAKGDRIYVGNDRANPAGGATGKEARPRAVGPEVIRVTRGPDPERFGAQALAALTSGPFVILPSSDRTGVRLSGPNLPRCDADLGRSAPMVRGAIQVPASEQPIVLGPDHPTTGGYPVLAVVAHADLGWFFARPIGANVRFAVVGLDEARRLVLA